MGFHIIEICCSCCPYNLSIAPNTVIHHSFTLCFGDNEGFRAVSSLGQNSGENGAVLGGKTHSSSRVQWKQEI